MLDTSPCLHINSTHFEPQPISRSTEKQKLPLDLEKHASPSVREVLQMKLQQRRTREELVSQGIMPPLKGPAAFHEQRRSLERARTEDYLKRKIRSRPVRSELIRMHILEETSAEPSLQAKQLLLKRARLADGLNDKLAQRPGPMELIHKNILSLSCQLTQAMMEAGVSSGDEDSCGAFSPDHFISQQSPLTTCLTTPSPDALPSTPSPAQVPPPPPPPPPPPAPPPPLPVTTEQNLTSEAVAAQRHAPGQAKGGKTAPERSRKARDSKPKVRKLKYHQYVPPDQKVGKEPAPVLDSTYAKLLHQQQLFLQLQIINQQQQHGNYQAILPAPPRPPGDQQAPSTNGTSSARTAAPPQPASTNVNSLLRQAAAAALDANLPPLPANLDELKVAELKHELKLRGLTVSGTKNDLIERLKNFQEQHGGNVPINAPISAAGGASGPAAPNSSTSQSTSQQPTQSVVPSTVLHQSRNSGMVVAAFPLVATLRGGVVQPAIQSHNGVSSLSPPGSPAPSEHSLAGMSPGDRSCNGDVFGDMVSSPLTQLSLHHSPADSFTAALTPPVGHPLTASGPTLLPHEAAAAPEDKDRLLQEKDRRIARLTRMLQQRQQQVEELRSQLQDQRSGGGVCQPRPPAAIKEEPEDIPMVEAEPEQQRVAEEIVMQQNELNLQRRSQHRRKKSYRQLQKHTLGTQPDVPSGQTSSGQASSSQQVSQMCTNQQSSHPLFPLDVLKSNSSQTLLMDSNGNHFLLTLTNHNTDNQANNNPPSGAANPVALQSKEPMPTKQGSQSAPRKPNGNVQSKPLTICKQPIKKALKPEKHVSANHLKARYAMSNPQTFIAAVDPAPSKVLIDASSNQTEEMLVGADQCVVLSPSSPNPRPTLTSRRKKNGRTQRVDNLFDILVQNGEILENFRPTPDPALSRLCPITPPLSPSPSPSQPSPASPSVMETRQEPLLTGSSAQGEITHCSAGGGRLEDFLESTTGKPLLGVEPGGYVTLIDELHSQMLSTPSILDHPISPMDTYDFGMTSNRSGLELAESALDGMDWLDLGMGGADGPGIVALNGHPSTSVFSADFLDSSDLQLHWDACL